MVGPVGIGGANAFKGQWLDLAPLIQKNNYDLSGFPEQRRRHLQARRGPGRHPVRDLPVRALLPEGRLRGGRPQRAAAQVRRQVHDGRRQPGRLDIRHARARSARSSPSTRPARTRRQAGFDPKKISQWGFELQRDDLRGHRRVLRGRPAVAGADGKTVQIPDAGRPPGSIYYQSIWTDHISLTDAQFESKDINPNDYPFFAGNIAMSENFLWSTYGLGDMRRLGHRGHPLVQRQGDRGVQRRHLPDPEVHRSTRTRRSRSCRTCSVTRRRSCSTAYGGFPARTADQPAGITALQAQFKNQVDWQVAVDGIQLRRQAELRGAMPAYNESLGLVGSGGKYLTELGNKPGLDMDAEIQNLKTDLQAIWDKAP